MSARKYPVNPLARSPDEDQPRTSWRFTPHSSSLKRVDEDEDSSLSPAEIEDENDDERPRRPVSAL